MNPDTNKFEATFAFEEVMEGWTEDDKDVLARLESRLVRADGSPVPKHWSVFEVGEHVVIKDYTFKVAYIGESAILFEPVGLPVMEPGG